MILFKLILSVFLLFFTGCTSVFDILNNNIPKLVTNEPITKNITIDVHLNSNKELKSITSEDFEYQNLIINSIHGSKKNYTLNVSFIAEGDAYIQFKNTKEISNQKLAESNKLLLIYDVTGPMPVSNISLSEVPSELNKSPALTFDQASDTYSKIDRYQVQVVDKTNNIIRNWQNFKSGDAINFISDLDSYTEYRFKIRAIDALGNIGTEIDSGGWKPRSICKEEQLSNTPFASGTGTVSDPYVLCTAQQLQEIDNQTSELNKSFILGADLDLSVLSDFNSIGTAFDAFSGIFNGNNKKIKNLTMNISGAAYGLFFQLGNYSRVFDLSFVNPVISSIDGGDVSVLSGYQIRRSQISNITITGADLDSGGEVAMFSTYSEYSQFFDIHIEGSINSTGDNVAGFVNTIYYGSFYNITSDNLVISGADHAAGIGGWAYHTYVQNAHLKANITNSGTVTGGFFGLGDYNEHIYRSSFQGFITGTTNVGGLIGQTYGNFNIIQSSKVKAVITGTSYVGGLLGNNTGAQIYNSYSRSTINGIDVAQNDYVGGLLGYSYSTIIENSYSSGSVDSDTGFAGGLIGYADEKTTSDNELQITSSFSGVVVSGDDSSNIVSGFLGSNNFANVNSYTITDSYYMDTCTNNTGSCNTDFGISEASLSRFYLSTNTPLSSWDFTNIWSEVSGDLPELNGANPLSPTFTQNCSTTASVGALYNCLTDIDSPSQDPNEIILVSLAQETTCNWLAPRNYMGNKAVEGTPSTEDVGTCDLVVYVTDGEKSSEKQTIEITVSP